MTAVTPAALLGAPITFVDDAVLAYWDGAGEETAPRTVARGRNAIGGVLEDIQAAPPGQHLSIRDGQDWFVEASLPRASGGAGITLAASAQLDRAGAVTRCLVFHAPAVEARPTWDGRADDEPASGLAILERYFRHLVAGELVEATACFSEDCLYSHPPYRPGTPRVAFRGRDELLEGFRETRGPRSSRAEIVCSVQHRADCFIEGVVEGDAGPKGSFVSSATLGRDGLIRRYVAFYTSSRVPRR
jgi:hypothetical protein